MARFEPVVIERRGAHYTLLQGSRRLFEMPAALFETFDADCVFPPGWPAKGEGVERRARQILWQPERSELLMNVAGIEQPPRIAELYGRDPFRAYLAALWQPAPPRLLLHPYWNPTLPTDSFGAEEREASYRAQRALFDLLAGLRPPRGWLAVFNATEKFQAAAEAARAAAQPGARLVADPAGKLGLAAVEETLREVAVERVGTARPALGAQGLLWIDTANLAAKEEVSALLTRRGVAFRIEPYRAH